MDSKKTGQGMMTIAVVLGMALLTFYFTGVEERQRNPNQAPQSLVYSQSVEVPLKRNRQGHYLVVGSINGHDVEFLLDTGATDVVVPERTAKRLGLAYGRRGRAMTANGAVTIFRTRIAKLQIGEITLYDIDASINPGMGSGAILLGMSALSKIEFSQRGNTLTLRQISG
jgi:aspartyl protease family protein